LVLPHTENWILLGNILQTLDAVFCRRRSNIRSNGATTTRTTRLGI